MRRIYALLILIVPILFTKISYAQTGELHGKVIDSLKKEGIPFAPVGLFQGGEQKYQGQTDVDGNYVIKPVTPGTYTIKVIYLGYSPVEYNNVQVTPDNISKQNVYLKVGVKVLQVVNIVAPLVKTGDVTQHTNFSAKQISEMAEREVSNVVGQSGGVTQKDQGSGLNINGGRGYAATYYLDGVPIPASGAGTVDVPTSSIEDIDVVTGGIPAKYGNATSGIINITTKGPSKLFNGGIDLETSQYLDSYGYDLGSFSLSGPVIKRFKKSDSTDNDQAKVGFFVAGQIEHALNGSFGRGGNTPPAFPIYTVKPDVLANIEANPLQPNPAGFGFVPTAESLTPSDLTTSDYKLDVPSTNYTFAGKLNFQFAKNLNLVVGGNIDYSDYYNYSYSDQLLDPENQGHQTQGTYRVFARFTQLFNSGTGNDNKHSASVFQNAYYTVQADYSDFVQKFADVVHGSDLFNYGYIGKFQDYYKPTYTFGADTIAKKSGWLLTGYQDTLVKFTPGAANPLLTNYTTQYYNLAGSNSSQYYSSLFQIENGGGLINGETPNSIYSMWSNVGAPSGVYGYRNFGQYHFAVNGSVDIVPNPGAKDKNGKDRDKGRHAIEFGIEYQQDNQKLYEIFPVGLWSLMRQLTSPTNMALDTKHPHAVTDKYGNYEDTIKYTRVDTNQNWFDIQLRNKIGAADSVPVYVDELSPSTFSLNMFTPDELANNGAYNEFYYGYNYLGQNLSSQPKFDDFFTQKDANGNYVRNNPAFTPNYAAAYIQDKFNLNDIVFNIGLRIDRYDDAEQQLKDPYLLYPARTASEVTNINGNPYTAPANIGGNYVVYVDNPTSPTKVLGFRNGDQWYLANGTQTSDPNLIAQATQNGTIAPYLVNTTSATPALDGSSFTSYTPQISVMPRVAFSFPISDHVQFFAHYDILTERPSVLNIGNTLTGDDVTATPWQYYYLKQLTTDYVMTNPALKPEKTIDYQVGYEQELGENSAISISLLYRDLQDLVEVQRVVYAYPYDYNTFSNTDFGNVKSLLFSYTLRRTKNISLSFNYTLSFAEGTGSSATSSLSQLSESNPNLQVVTPFSYDQRHTLTGVLDYRFPHEHYNGPMIGNTPILRDFGVNYIIDAFSGTPYTQQANVLPTVLSGVQQRAINAGDINGGRLPWSYRMNLKVDKAFGVTVGHHTRSFPQGRQMSFDIYLLVTNLLNTQNVLSVYAFTGNPGDDGYLESAPGKQYVAQQDYPSSFSNLYQIRVDNPDNFSQPRTIHLGVQVGF